MRANPMAVVGAFFGLGIALFIGWTLRSQPATRTGGVSVTFVGLTNDASGGTLAQFRAANTSTRRIQLGLSEPQTPDSNGWPKVLRNPGGGMWFCVEAGSNAVFAVAGPDTRGSSWRLPIVYCEDQTVLEEVRDRTRSVVAYGLAKLAGRPAEINRTRRLSLVYGPELLTTSNQLPQDVFDKPKAEQNAAPNAAAPHR